MEGLLRESGINIIGNVPWGTHFVQFYQTKEDLIDILIPYFKEGLKNNEFCMWVVSEPLSKEEAEKSIRKVVPDFDKYLRRGQIEIIPYTEWYLKNGDFNHQRVLNGWLEKMNQALDKGYDGLRVTGNTFWLEKYMWKDFTDYELEVNNIIGNYKMLAICTYSLDKCGANEILDAVSTHQFALIKREDTWKLIESSELKETKEMLKAEVEVRKQIEEKLRGAYEKLEIRVQERTSELEEANKASMESEARYRELTESIDDLFYAMDGDLRYTYWNKTSEALTGILAKDAIGKSLYELFPDIKGTKAEQSYLEALKTQQPARFEIEYQLGEKKHIFEINAYPTKDGLSVITKDITEKRKLESQLLRAQRMESIGTLAGGIAHDLNNVMTPIMLSLQTLEEKFKDEQSQRLLTILERNLQRGADLIKQVMSFARGIEGERKPIQVAHMIFEVEKVAKETFPKNIEIKTNISKDRFSISGDATQLYQVIMNLCVNARDAMPDGGVLDISVENFYVDESYARMNIEAKVGQYIVITVSDTGTGIPPKIIDRIFEPFFTTKEHGKGTGLGLSTSLGIVRAHGGFIDVQSKVGKGTTFKVYLPAVKTEIQKIEEHKLKLPAGSGELILIVEDEGLIREITCTALESHSYKVLIAENGEQAVVYYAQNKDKIKVILMDLMMPIMDGEESIRAIRKINPEAKIITVSGLAEKDKLKKVSDYTNAFLPKPYTAEKLLKTIHEVISTK